MSKLRQIEYSSHKAYAMPLNFIYLNQVLSFKVGVVIRQQSDV
jgi:hypothetical protein